MIVPVSIESHRVLDGMFRGDVVNAGDAHYWESDPEFRKQAFRESASEAPRAFEWVSEPLMNPDGSYDKLHVLFLVRDSDELEGRLAVLEVMGT